MKKAKALLFDLGNTLVEYEGKPWIELHQIALGAALQHLESVLERSVEGHRAEEAYRAALEEEQIKGGHEGREILLETILKGMVARLGAQADSALIQGMVKAHYAPIRAQLTLYSETISTLQFLKDEGMLLGIVSNSFWPSSLLLEDLHSFGLVEFFDAMIFSGDFGFCKPHPLIFTEGLKGVGNSPGNTLFVGDRLDVDVQGAQSAGMRGILKRHRFHSDHDPAIRPHGIINRLSEIRNYL